MKENPSETADFSDVLPNLLPLGVIVAVLTTLTLKAYRNTLD